MIVDIEVFEAVPEGIYYILSWIEWNTVGTVKISKWSTATAYILTLHKRSLYMNETF